MRIMLTRVFRAAGYEVQPADGIRHAVTLFEAVRPDLVVMDLRMADHEGWAAFEEIRRLDPSVPLIATTALSNQVEQAVQRGIDALMEKPLDIPVLLSRVSQLLIESEEARIDRRRRTALVSHVQAAA